VSRRSILSTTGWFSHKGQKCSSWLSEGREKNTKNFGIAAWEGNSGKKKHSGGVWASKQKHLPIFIFIFFLHFSKRRGLCQTARTIERWCVAYWY